MVERIRVRAGHSLTDHPMVKAGTLRIETSTDGKHYYPLKEVTNPGQVRRGTIEADDLGLRVRHVRLKMLTEQTPEHGVWSVSELVLWGQEAADQ